MPVLDKATLVYWGIAGGALIILLAVYLINKFSKGLMKKTRAVITDVEVRSSMRRSSQTGRRRRVRYYAVHYQYTVDGTEYKGCMSSNSRKKKGKKIKIYYDPMDPEKSELTERTNYMLKLFFFIGITLGLLYILLRIAK